ncbi:ketopantoate reductase family protein [Paenibacillus sanguinis]|uniref:ketopantoate reductase family protein n=1 Tax=Paenibacillus sanguinis TaxID=225906 RepID=UPI000372A659|nr:2-dehydropantoate 2-reductase [Paenibacillus sanguinis]
MGMRINIIGAGALGLLFGSKLIAAGEKVRFWTRTPEQSVLLKAEGIRLTEAGGRPQVIQGQKFEADCLSQFTEEALPLLEEEWLFLTLKQRDIDDRLLRKLKEGSRPNTNWVCFQNGIGHLEKIRQVLPEVVLLSAITTEGAKRTDSRSVTRAGHGATKIGGIIEGLPSKELSSVAIAEETVVHLLQKAGFTATVSQDINREIYRKLIINATINPLTALWRVPNGELLATKERRAMLWQLSHEGEQICAAYGIAIGTGLHEQIVAVCEATSANTSSMLKDVMEGKPTEIDNINGRLVDMACAKNIPAPGHHMVWRLIRGFEGK